MQNNSYVTPEKCYPTNINKKRLKDRIELTIRYLISALLILFFIFQYLYMFNKSVMVFLEANEPGRFFPSLSQITFRNYRVFFDYLPYFRNSFVIVAINGVFLPLSGCFAAYPFARLKFKGKKVIFAVVMATAMVPGAVTMVPMYVLYVRMGLVDKVASQWIGAFFGGSSMQIFLIMQFMRSIPKELDNAAQIDGANKLYILIKILMPLCMNVFIYIGIGTVIGRWSDFQGPLIMLRTPSKWTMAVAFYYNFNASLSSQFLPNQKCAMAVCMSILPIVLFFTFQKTMIGGIKVGAIKS